MASRTGAGQGAGVQGRRRGAMSGGVVKLGMGWQRELLAGGGFPGGWRDAGAWLFSEGPWGRVRGSGTGCVKGNSSLVGKMFSTGEHFKHWNRLPKVVEEPPSVVFSRPCLGDHMKMWRSLAIPSSEQHWCHTRLLRAWSSHTAISLGDHCHHRGALQAPVQLAWVHFCIASTLPAMPNLSRVTPSCPWDFASC